MEENQSQYSPNQQFRYAPQQNFQQRSQQKQQSESTTDDYFCRKCGARVPRFNRFCEECGEPVDNNVCQHCNGKLSGPVEICPYCGKPVDVTRCTFCGGVIDPEDNFCCDCGNQVHGVNCPVCGTLNFRNFCRNCNTPLTELAQIQINRVKNDPRVLKTQQLAVELEQLEQKIQALQNQIGCEGSGNSNVTDGVFEKPQSTLSEEDQKILETYNNLFGKGVVTPKEVEKPKPAAKVETKPAQNQTSNPSSNSGSGSNPELEQLKQQYQQKVKEMGSALLDLIPDPQDPPIIQRDFLCACKVMTGQMVQKNIKERIAWVCNLCGCRHRQPSECAQPQLGGTWIYEERTITTHEMTETQIFL